MRKTIFAAIALCPMLLQAQVLSPAQPKSADTNPVLVSGLMKGPGAFFGAGGAIPDTPPRVFSEVKQPKLIQAAQVEEKDRHWRSSPAEKLAVVSVIVDSSGKPSEIHIVRSLGQGMDNDVIASVSNYRFQPGMLNHASVAMPVELTIKIHSVAQ